MNSGMTITVVKSEPGLISKYHMSPVPMVPVPVPACPYAASVAIQSGRVSDTPLLTNVFLPCGQKHNVQLYPDSRRREKPVSPHDSEKDMVSSWCIHPRPMPMWPLDGSSLLPNTTEDFGDAALWHPCCSSISPSETAHDQTTKQWVQEFQISYWLIPIWYLKCNLCTATAHSWMYMIQMRHTAFRSN